MELYEIVKKDIIERYPNGYASKPSVITATMDKDMAEQMLSIYRHNRSDNEEYDIRIVQAPNRNNYEFCLNCNSFNRCVSTIHLHPNEMIRCIRFGELKEYIKKENTK